MESFVLARATNTVFDARLLEGMFRLRDEIFKQRLGWDVESHDGQEIDGYDAMDPYYVVAHDPVYRVNGCFRLLPTTGPYMLRDIFPELLRGDPVPRDRSTWELSRLAIRPAHRTDARQANLSNTTFGIIQSIYDFAIKKGIHEYVTVTSVALERVLKKVGFPLIRFGDGQAMQIGKVMSVACRIPVNEQFLAALTPVETLTGNSPRRVVA